MTKINVVSVIRLSTISLMDAWLLAGTDGQQILIRNLPSSGNIVTLNNQNAGSTAANRFQGLNLASPNADVILMPGSAILLLYDGTLAYWVMIP